MSIRTRYVAQGTGSGGSAAGAAQDDVAGANCPGSCLCGWLSRRGPGMTRLVVAWDLKVAGVSFEIVKFLRTQSISSLNS